MWTSTLELVPAHVIPTKLLGYIWRGAYFSSFAPLQVRNLPRQPLPASNWVRVRNALAGICGSDLPLIFVDGDFNIAPAAIPSHGRSYPGHEVVGEVIEVGNDVRHLRVGDRVVLQSGPNCITAGIQQPCRSCASGQYSLCEYGVLPGTQPIGGGWSEEMLLHEQQLFRIPGNIHDMQAVLLEPTAVAIHAVLRHLPQAKERVLIIGSGTIGLLILQVVRALAPEAEVCVLARHAFQIEQAARLGAQIIYPQDSYKEVQRATNAKLYKGMMGNQMLLGGYDVIYDTVGSTSTTQDALRWARAGSTVVMVGVHLHRMQVDLTPIWYQEINLVGSMGHGIESWPIGTFEKTSTFEVAVELMQRKQIFPDKLITHSFPLSGYRDAIMTAANKARNRAIKVVFDYSKQPPSVVPNVRAAARQHQRAITAPIDTRPTQSPTPLEAGLSQGASLPWIEEEVPFMAPAPVDRIDTTYQEAPPSVPSIDETSSATDIYDEDNFGATDQVPAMHRDVENEESDTIPVHAPAQFKMEDQSFAFFDREQEDATISDSGASLFTREQEDAAISDNSTSLSERESEHSISTEAPLTESDELPQTPATATPEITEENAPWLHSLTFPPTDESPPWLQALAPSQADEGEEDVPITATTGINEEHPAEQVTDTAGINEERPAEQVTDAATTESEATQTVVVSAPKRSRSKHKTRDLGVTHRQKAHSEESESSQSELPILEGQEQQASTDPA